MIQRRSQIWYQSSMAKLTTLTNQAMVYIPISQVLLSYWNVTITLNCNQPNILRYNDTHQLNIDFLPAWILAVAFVKLRLCQASQPFIVTDNAVDKPTSGDNCHRQNPRPGDGPATAHSQLTILYICGGPFVITMYWIPAASANSLSTTHRTTAVNLPSSWRGQFTKQPMLYHIRIRLRSTSSVVQHSVMYFHIYDNFVFSL